MARRESGEQVSRLLRGATGDDERGNERGKRAAGGSVAAFAGRTADREFAGRFFRAGRERGKGAGLPDEGLRDSKILRARTPQPLSMRLHSLHSGASRSGI